MAAIVASQRNGVIKIPRAGRVNRHDRDGTQIETRAELGFVELLGQFASLIECRDVEGVGDIEGTDDRQRIDAGLASLTEDLGDDPLPFKIRSGIANHLHG